MGFFKKVILFVCMKYHKISKIFNFITIIVLFSFLAITIFYASIITIMNHQIPDNSQLSSSVSNGVNSFVLSTLSSDNSIYYFFLLTPDNSDGEKNTHNILLLVILILVNSLLVYQSIIFNKLYYYWYLTRHFNIKFWDSIYSAINHGIIHQKIFNNIFILKA